MPLGSLFSSRSDSLSIPTSINTGFSEVGGPATSINVNLAGRFKVGKGGTLSPIINLTDQGAIAAAQRIADQSLHQVELFGGTIGDAITGALAAARAAGSDAIGAVSESQRGETENVALQLVKWGALAFAVYAGARIFWKGG